MGEIINYSDIQFGSSYCSNEQLVSKIIFNIDSNEYITSAIYLDSNSTILNSYYYHFCDEDTVLYGCTDLNACNYDSEANYSGTVLSPSFGACLYAQEYFDCDGNCINDIDNDLVCNELEVIGCTDLNACNYDLSATDEGYCIYPQIYYDCDGNCINDIDNDEECDELDYDDDLSVKETDYDTSKIIKIIDIFGIERKENRNGILLFYIYDNGKVEKKFFKIIEDKDLDVLDYWGMFDSVSVGASLDASGSRAELMRKGSDWKKTTDNRERMLKKCPNVDFYISPTLSIMNIQHVPEFHKDWTARGLLSPADLNVNVLQSPEWYRVDCLPTEMLSLIHI